MDKRIGAQFFTIRDYCRTLSDFENSCRRVSEIGYKTVQLSGIGDFSGKDVRRILEKYDLECVCTHRTPQKYLSDLEREIEFHKEIGCRICGLGAMPGFNVKKETILQFAADFRPVIQKLNENGLVFAYHNHAFEFEKLGEKYAFDIITEEINSENFKYILDVFWLAYAGIDPAQFISERSGRIACVHFKDLKIKDGTPQFAEAGAGNINWDAVIPACRKAGAEYALVEQDECDGDPFTSLQKSYSFLTGKGFV